MVCKDRMEMGLGGICNAAIVTCVGIVYMDALDAERGLDLEVGEYNGQLGVSGVF